MASPPERITVKRRLDDDPVNALVIHKKRQRPSAVWRLADKGDVAPTHTQSLRPFNPTNEPCPEPNISIPSRPGASFAGTTILDQEYDWLGEALSSPLQHGAQHPQMSLHVENLPPATSFSRPTRRNENSQRLNQNDPRLRKFHLSVARSITSSPHTSFKSSVRRNRKSQRTDLAVFEESKGQLLGSAQAHGNQELESERPGVKDVGSEHTASTTEPPRKKPNASLEERKWRAENWGRPVKPRRGVPAEPESDQKAGLDGKWDVESLELAEQLHQITLQEMQAEEQRARVKSSSRQPKHQPKPPKARHQILMEEADTDRGDVAMADSDIPDNENNYVFDTYIRFQSNTQPSGAGESAESGVDPLQGIDHGNIGVIVIDDDKEEDDFWEIYGEKQESDPEWNSEEEDENGGSSVHRPSCDTDGRVAEDFYGNDYPEDEVNSDDEHGRGAYDYRYGASDDEEFGEEAVWTDDGNETRPSWSKHRAHTVYGTAN